VLVVFQDLPYLFETLLRIANAKMEDFLAGGSAALMAITIMHPVDVVKTRLQLQGELGSSGGAYRGVFGSLLSIARSEGFQGLYRGILPAYCLQFTVTAVRFGVYGLAKKVFNQEEKSAGTNFVLAAISGACGGFLGAPFFALKTRAQAFSSAAELAVGKSQQKPPDSLFQSFREIAQREGPQGFFRGIDAFVPRVVMYGAAQLGVYDFVKPIFRDKLGLGEGVLLHLSTAVVAATAAVIVIQPFDFLAARLMNQPVNEFGNGLYYNGFFDCAHKSVQNEGLRCFLKGGWANMARMAPYTVLVLIFFEQTKNVFTFKRNSIQ